MTSKLKWLFLIQVLLTHEALGRASPPQTRTDKRQLPQNHIQEEARSGSELNHLISGPQPRALSADKLLSSKQERSKSAARLTAHLKAKLQGQNQDYLNIQGQVSCAELMAASTVDDSLSYALPQELLGLSLVPVLVVANCPKEAQSLVEKLYNLLGMSDTEQLLLDLESLMERKLSKMAASTRVGKRVRRSPQRRRCINSKEQQVYKVTQWIPAVSTLYNLGTAVYYASVNCSETAKERAILSAVDLGTDALMVVTGGTAGVVGYAFGAGVKTGVKAGVRYMMDDMREEEGDIMVNRFRWDDDSVTFQ
uniref:Apolipoprotein F n=1 Tax=Neogobius melanostomus TaxID=47308 RepID=A0A8C6UP02_9GOBI